MKKYIGVMETLNEAESQAMDGGNIFSSDTLTSNDLLQSVCKQTLLVLSNRTELEFLRLIEGKDIGEIAKNFSNDSGHSLRDTKKYFDSFSKEISEIYLWLTTKHKFILQKT